MPWLAPPTIAMRSFRKRSMSAPSSRQTLVGEKRIVGGEQDSIFEPARDLVLELGRMIFRRPAMKLVPDAPFVHQHRNGLGLPRPARSRRNDLEIRIGGGDEIEMAGVTVIEN